jgi:electron transport complex protein RnfC
MWHSFQGGVHPHESKATSETSIETFPLPKRVVVPLSQHTGSPSKAVVKSGDAVRTGQVIAEATGFISAALHAPLSGTVAGIEIHPHPAGVNVESIIIDSDEKDEKAELEPRDPESLGPEQIIDAIRKAGIVGLGGAAFPTHVKLSPPKTKKIDTAILNGCECEPYLTCDHRVMLEDTEGVLGGFRLIMKALGVKNGVVAVEDNKKNALAAIRAALKPSEGISVVKLRTKYPQGAEKQLIRSLLGREVPSGKLPLDVGCVVQNVQTSRAVWDAVREGKPLYERVITLTGSVKKPLNVRVRIGTLLSDILAHYGGLDADVKKVVAGGPMMGITLTSLEVPVIKGTSGILALTAREARTYEPTGCIKCATCVNGCPMGLVPCMISRLVEKERYEELAAYRPMDCIECGTCAYGCPAKIYLVQNIKRAKAIVLGLKKKE